MQVNPKESIRARNALARLLKAAKNEKETAAWLTLASILNVAQSRHQMQIMELNADNAYPEWDDTKTVICNEMIVHGKLKARLTFSDSWEEIRIQIYNEDTGQGIYSATFDRNNLMEFLQELASR